eukprot:9490602-Pyramimonas_sp.AAC.1
MPRAHRDETTSRDNGTGRGSAGKCERRIACQTCARGRAGGFQKRSASQARGSDFQALTATKPQ